MPRTAAISRGIKVPFQGSSPSVTKSDELVAVYLDALAYDGSDHGVQTGAVAAASQHSYAHGWSVPRTTVCLEVGCLTKSLTRRASVKPRRASARRQVFDERKTGFEPATLTLARCLSSSTVSSRVL